MKTYLNKYLEKIKSNIPALPPKAAHQIAFAFLSFKMGLYEDTIQRCRKSLQLINGTSVPSALRTALTILMERASDLAASRVQSSNLPEYTSDEQSYLALDIKPDLVDDPTHLTISNSVILIYAVAVSTSPEDTEALEEQERYIIHILSSYKQLISS